MSESLESHIQYIKGVGPKLAQLFANISLFTISDLLYHIPFRYTDRRHIDTTRTLAPGKDRTVIGDVLSTRIIPTGKRGRGIFELHLRDNFGSIAAVWFNFNGKYMKERLKSGQRLILSGETTLYRGRLQFFHPEVEEINEENKLEEGGRIIPIYPATEGISQKLIRKVIKAAWEKWNSLLKDELPKEIRDKYQLLPLWEALFNLHFPTSKEDPIALNEKKTRYHYTLAFTEIFLFELTTAIRRSRQKMEKGIQHIIHPEAHQAFLKALPFTLTEGQITAIKEIFGDMGKISPMNRLLQGDVGSGKTVVAMGAAIQAVANNTQVAFMAPTEVLAMQHYSKMGATMGSLGIRMELLTGSTKAKDKERLSHDSSCGKVAVIIGTHALIEDPIQFKKLGLVIIDEQHRFGVIQRARLLNKGTPDILVMTATPIPRTLAMLLYGDLDVSTMRELPAGRSPIVTKLYFESRRAALYEGMGKELAKGHQIYVVCPLIEESEKIDLKNATSTTSQLRKRFPEWRVELLHGKMTAIEKEIIMNAFKNGEIHVLVSTSVIEVGIDVPNATVMIIEQAERFGLSQLHQLRGRVGRGANQSYCILMAGYKLSEEARSRLGIMTKSHDGFVISEEDLKIRGPGDLMGVRQSGLPVFRFINIIQDVDLIQKAKDEAYQWVVASQQSPTQDHLSLLNNISAGWQRRLELSSIF